MITLRQIERLANATGPCLTIFQQVRDKVTRVTKTRTRLTAAIQQANELLAKQGFDTDAREQLLQPLHRVARSTDFFRRDGSVVILRGKRATKISSWPEVLKARVNLGGEFLILPLIPGLEAHGDFWILGLSINSVLLFRGTLRRLEQVELPSDLPQGLREAGGFDKPDHQLGNRASLGPSTGQMGVVHFGTSSSTR